jgi:membrane associated rhomboid family serine protease
MFPVKAQRKLTITPYVTYTLIGINVAFFIWELTLGANLSRTFREIALIPCQVGLNFDTLLNATRTLFLHATWVHLIGNMIFLIVFGPHLEQFFGRAWFAGFYFLAGYAANLAHLATQLNQCAVPFMGGDIPVVGASGAIFGLMGGFLLLFPATRVQMMVFFYRMPVGLVDVRAFLMLIYLFVVDLIDGIGSLGAETATTGGVAVWAHVGGFVAGLVFTFLFTAFIKPLPKYDEG